MQSFFEKTRYWWKEARIYELYIDKFAGDLQGLTSRLSYFNALGINCLHLLPHFPSPMVDDGYDITDYRGVRPDLGTIDDFKVLLDAAHAKGIRIIIDFVLNHTSNQHPWFIEASSSKDNPKRDFYLWREMPHGFDGATNAFPDIKPSNWIRNEKTNDYYFATFYPQQPDLNWDNPEVVQAMLENMEFWADLGVDGFRLDAAPYLIKRDNTSCRGLSETHQVIKHIRRHLEAKHPEVILLAEAHQSLALTKQYFGEGDECHMAYNFQLMEEMWMELVLGEPGRVAEMERASFEDIPDNCQWTVFLRNHDEIEIFLEDRGQLIEAIDPAGMYLFKEGTTTSMRIATAFQNDREKILRAFAMLYATPGTPIMYYGDEIGMQNLPIQKGIIDTRRYVRGNFDWKEAKKQMRDPASLWNSVRGMIRYVFISPFLQESYKVER